MAPPALKLVPVHEVALVEDQATVTAVPDATVLDETVKVAAGTEAGAVVPPPPEEPPPPERFFLTTVVVVEVAVGLVTVGFAVLPDEMRASRLLSCIFNKASLVNGPTVPVGLMLLAN